MNTVQGRKQYLHFPSSCCTQTSPPLMWMVLFSVHVKNQYQYIHDTRQIYYTSMLLICLHRRNRRECAHTLTSMCSAAVSKHTSCRQYQNMRNAAVPVLQYTFSMGGSTAATVATIDLRQRLGFAESQCTRVPINGGSAHYSRLSRRCSR